MKTLLMLGTLGEEQIYLEKELPYFGEVFVQEKYTNLEQLFEKQLERRIEGEILLGVEQYEYIILEKKNYELFLFGRTTNMFPYNSFEQYPAIGMAFKVEF
ncbi:MAG: hypothetical protein Q8R18_00285 [bacterium]|nr:hypothetical protein [bacterium]